MDSVRCKRKKNFSCLMCTKKERYLKFHFASWSLHFGTQEFRQAGRQAERGFLQASLSYSLWARISTYTRWTSWILLGWGRRIWGWVARGRGGYLVHNNLEKTLVDRNFEFFSGLGNLDKMLLKLPRQGVWRGSRAVCAGAAFPWDMDWQWV